jgi:type II restriction enzyme
MSVYEQTARVLLIKRGIPEADVKLKYKLGGQISDGQRAVIAQIVSDLSNGSLISRGEQVDRVLAARSQGTQHTPKPATIDLFYREREQEFYVDMKTVKPNIGSFKEYKRQLLEWVARRNASVNTLIALPYNPYYPQSYQRFTVRGLLILGEEMQIGEEFWNGLAGWPIYDHLLEVFDEVGRLLHGEVIDKIKTVASESL